MDRVVEFLTQFPDLTSKILLSLLILLILSVVKRVISITISRRVKDSARVYHWHRAAVYIHVFLVVILVGSLWISGIESIATFLGLAGAGIAVAMHDTIANIAGWAFILWRKPFVVGDRVQIADKAGDIIDIRLFQFSMIEIGNWIDAEQSTGRILHVPNSKVLRETLCNYETGFRYIWHEIPVLITFESNWEQAKEILTKIAQEKTEHLSQGAESEIRRAAGKYLIHTGKLSPIVYTTVRDSGVLLTMRYIVKPRLRRGSEQDVWEEILRAFAKESDIELAYPTTRFFDPPAEST